MRALGWIIALGLVLLGGLSVHYTFGEGIDHHREWALRHGLPVPSFTIFLSGVAEIALGGACLGWMLARRVMRKRNDPPERR
jgi:hypothetical protein